MSAFNNMITAIKDMQDPPNDGIKFGRVITVNPLTIQIGEQEPLPASFFILGQMCRPHTLTVMMPHTHVDSGAVDQPTMILSVLNPLNIGDTVLLLPFNSNQKFYVAEVIK